MYIGCYIHCRGKTGGERPVLTDGRGLNKLPYFRLMHHDSLLFYLGWLWRRGCLLGGFWSSLGVDIALPVCGMEWELYGCSFRWMAVIGQVHRFVHGV
jgi:hypothetical protein